MAAIDPHDIACPTCSSPAHVACTRDGRFTEHPHEERRTAALHEEHARHALTGWGAA